MELTLSNVSYFYQSISGEQFPALVDFSYSFSGGKVYGIFGHTGSGKSTLLQVLTGLLYPERGQLLIDEKVFTKAESHILRDKVGLVFQYPEHQFFEESIYEEVAFALRLKGEEEDIIKKKVLDTLKILDFPVEEYDIYNRSPFELSGGEERKVAIASFLVKNPEFLILDEPTAGLDPVSCQSVEKVIIEYKKLKRGVILVTHDIIWALKIIDEVLVLEKGRLIFSGTPSEYLRNLSNIYSGDDIYLPEELLFLKELEKRGRFSFQDISYFDVEMLVKVIKKQGGKIDT